MPQPDHGAGQPVLEGQLGLDPVRRRHARARTDRDLRDPGLRLRRATTLRRASLARYGTTTRSATASSSAPATCGRASVATSGCAERGCHALALDGDKRQVDSLTSNIGHLLWSGILDDDEAAATAERLLDEQLYSGWGVRTLGAREAGYNPLGYHTGTIWPHDNSLIAAGLARYGHHEAAATIASAILAAAPYFEHRLPEVFAGFPVALTSVPVAFPTASRPQAWAAGAPLLLLTTLLGLKPGDTRRRGGPTRADRAHRASAEQPDRHATTIRRWRRSEQ